MKLRSWPQAGAQRWRISLPLQPGRLALQCSSTCELCKQTSNKCEAHVGATLRLCMLRQVSRVAKLREACCQDLKSVVPYGSCCYICIYIGGTSLCISCTSWDACKPVAGLLGLDQALVREERL